MRRQVESVCDRHPDRHDCPDALVDYSPRFREYGLLVHDGGSSWVLIRFCPWCGSRLAESLRDEWFAEMERRGINPWKGEVPAAFQSSAWWAARQDEPGAAADGGDM
jgi:hypothetical protein